MDKTTIRVELKEIEDLIRKYPGATKEATVGRLTEALLLLQGDVQEKTPVGAGPIHLRDTVFHEIETGQPMRGLLGTPLQHGLPVEMGTKPHFPPIAPLQYWVEKVIGLEGKKARSMAFAIATIMARSSRLGVHMFSKTLERRRRKVISILSKIPADIIKKAEKT